MPEPGTSDRGARAKKPESKKKKRGEDDAAGGGGGSASGGRGSGKAPSGGAGGGFTAKSVPMETPPKANKFAKLAGILATKKHAEGKKDVLVIGAEVEKAEVR